MKAGQSRGANRYRVPFNKHKYSDLSDSPKQSSMVASADNAREAGDAVAAKRTSTETSGLRTVQGSRYFIGIIHYDDIR